MKPLIYNWKLSALTLAIASFHTPTFASSNVIEVLHFWTNPGEIKALGIFADAYRKGGGEWNQIDVENMEELRHRAIKRMVLGFPPTALQWHAGPELQEVLKLDLARPLDDVTNADDIRTKLHPAIADAVSYNGKLGAVPVGVHGNNWAWYNSQIYRALKLPLPESWAEFLEQAPLIAAAGYEPIALGGGTWELAILFDAVLIDVAGKTIFRKLIEQKPLTKDDQVSVAEAVSIFRKLRPYVSSDLDSSSTWADATKTVIEGQSAVQIMGDWAKGAFVEAGKKPGVDFECRLAPGNNDAFMITLDVFMLPKTQDAKSKQAQSAFVDTLLDPENQLRFTALKGALPVIKEFDPTTLDECASLGLDKFYEADSTLPSRMLSISQERSALLETVLFSMWDDIDMSDETATNMLIDQIF